MAQAGTLPGSLADERARATARQGLRRVLGNTAWNRLPEAVRERFAEHAGSATYAGGFEIVRASLAGKLFAWCGRLLGRLVVTRTGSDVAAVVRLKPDCRGTRRGVEWIREYCWADGRIDVVRSTKVITDDALLVEWLPARLCMPLDVFEEGGVLCFVSRGYYFDLGRGLKLWLPRLLTPGVTRVEHIDLGHGWFRFTMIVTHPLFGEMFFQTGRFCAAEDPI